jgi:hypothetical protein
VACGPYYGNTHFVPVLLAHSNGVAYAVGDVLGEVQEISMPSHNRGGVIRRIVLLDTEDQQPDLRLFFFREEPTTGTYTDNAPLALNATDMANYIGHVDVSGWETDGSLAYLALEEVDQEYRVESATHRSQGAFWFITQINSIVTYTGSGKLRMTFGIWPD